jgi:glucosamine--fructose-6-phosphate aminotransferase (isomerizing)
MGAGETKGRIMTHWMLSEIREQPQTLRQVAEKEWDAVCTLAEAIRREELHYVMLAARGTSDNAAKYGKYLLEIENGLPCGLAAPSVVTLYRAQLNLKGCLVIGISQSGEAPDVIEYLSHARSAGAVTASITNNPLSPLAQISDYPLCIQAGTEKSVAATKTYTGTLAVIYLLAEALKTGTNAQEKLMQVAVQMERFLGLEAIIRESVDRYRYVRECVTLARGINQATAEETALKFIETCYLLSKPYSVADFMHGPFALVEAGFPCFLFAPEGATFPTVLEAAAKLREGGAETITFSHDEQILSLARTPIRVPVPVEEALSPMLYIVLGQLFSYYLAVTRDLNPDQPRGLQKITKTR